MAQAPSKSHGPRQARKQAADMDLVLVSGVLLFFVRLALACRGGDGFSGVSYFDFSSNFFLES